MISSTDSVVTAKQNTQVGSDANADMLRAALTDSGVDLEHLRQIPGPTGTAVILLQPSGPWRNSPARCLPRRPSVSLTKAQRPNRRAEGVAAGENSIIIVGGANTQEWEFSEAADQARAVELDVESVTARRRRFASICDA